MAEYVKEYAEDPLARDTVINAFATNKFKKPIEASIRDHQDRMETIMNYVDVLPGVRQTDLTYQEQKKFFFNTHPEEWKKEFILMKDILTCNMTVIRDFMAIKKTEADKNKNKKEKEKEKKKKDDSTTKSGGRGRSKGRGGKGKGHCRTHPNGNYTWKDCNQNPRI